MKSAFQSLGVVAALALAACQVPTGQYANSPRPFHQPRIDLAPVSDLEENGESEQDADGDEVRISADQIPQAIKDAAVTALPGLLIEEAELEDAGKTYCVHGTVEGKFREVEVSTEGAVASVESANDDEDGEGDDD